jgi:DNA ligase-1
MSADQRNFTEFDKFPGTIISNVHTFPMLWHTDGFDRPRKWVIYVRLIRSGMADISGIDWDIKIEKQLKIKSEYYQVGISIPDNVIAEVWAETGISDGKITRNAPTYFTVPLNIGKSNERNVFQTALIYARSQWLKRKDKGGRENLVEQPQNGQSQNGQSQKNKLRLYFPMLAKQFKDGKKHLEFPLYIQPKLDGVRCLMYLSKKNGGPDAVIAYTRNHKIYNSADYIKQKIYKYLNALYYDDSIYLDGELYKHGKILQDISGDSRNDSVDTSENNTNRNEYHIYDCFYPNDLDAPFEERHEQLLALYAAIKKEDSSILKEVPTKLVPDMKTVNKEYRNFVKLGYEGVMLRNINGVYLTDPNKTGAFLRSKNLVKLKQAFSDEFKIIGYTEGSKGKDKGAIIWICKTPENVEFNVTPKDMTYEQRKELYNDAKENFDKKYKNKMLTIDYEALSKIGVPLRAKAVVIRDYE